MICLKICKVHETGKSTNFPFEIVIVLAQSPADLSALCYYYDEFGLYSFVSTMIQFGLWELLDTNTSLGDIFSFINSPSDIRNEIFFQVIILYFQIRN
jgi:hypothetical protein